MTDVIIIGSGIAGLQCANILTKAGKSVIVLERESYAGGHVAQWHTCYPFEKTGKDIVAELSLGLATNQIIFETNIESIEQYDGFFRVIANGIKLSSRAIIIATGYQLFDARIKEELGYGVYPRVITSVDLEKAWCNGQLPFDTSDSDAPRFAIVHCVGSRDLKCGVTHCSKVCCMAAIKAAKELKEHYPTCQVTNYYMDLRMFDTGYEELYHSAQTECNVQFLRGRISEISLGNRGRLKLKSEDTLLGIPVADRVHGVVLMVGMQPPSTISIGKKALEINSNGFFKSVSALDANITNIKGVFITGACKGPKTITETLADAKATALLVMNYKG